MSGKPKSRRLAKGAVTNEGAVRASEAEVNQKDQHLALNELGLHFPANGALSPEWAQFVAKQGEGDSRAKLRPKDGRLGERGVALPLTLILLSVLMALTVAFSALSTSEPIIANNHSLRTTARGMAESGVERAIWALNRGVTNPTDLNAVTYPIGGNTTAGNTASTYNGTNFTVSSFGGFTLTMQNGANPNEITVNSVGWAPTNAAGNAKDHITATLTQPIPPLWNNVTCALCVNGNVSTGGNSSVNAASDTSCGNKYGAAAFGTGTTSIQKPSSITSPLSPSFVSGQSLTNWNSFALTSANLAALKSLAQQSGTYYQGTFSGQLPNGVVFVDTVSGNPVTASTPSSDLANVSLSGSCCVDPTGFHGWLIANGNLAITGNGVYSGVLYALEDFSIAGSASINGIVVAANVTNPNPSSVNASDLGTSSIAFNCAAAKANGYLPTGRWSLKVGSFTDVAN